MREVYMADVGDGQSIGVKTLFRHNIQIDCGGESEDRALDGFKNIIREIGRPNTFILSHFHIDHYYGLLEWAKRRQEKLDIENVYYPVIPKPPKFKKIFECQLALNYYVYGDKTGSMVLDFLNSIRRVNQSGFYYKALKQSDVLNIGGTDFEVLWPPKYVNKKITSKVERVIGEFKEIMDEYKELKDIYKEIKNNDIFERDLRKADETYFDEEVRETKDIWKKDNIPDDIDDLNGKIRDVTNRLSLAIRHGNYFIFWGDLHKREINNIIRDLDEEKFLISITPHHGTRWPSKFEDVDMKIALSSNGEERASDFKEEYKNKSNISMSTFVNGDIKIPSPLFTTTSDSFG